MRETKFKQTEAGLIPVDWKLSTLGEISRDPSYGVSAEAIPFNGKDKYIRITDIDDISGAFVPNPLASPAFYSDQHVVQENDLLVARTGASVGKSYLYNKKDGNLVYAGFLMKLNIYAAYAKYVFYSTRTSRYKSWVSSESARTGQPGLNLEQLKCYLIPIPHKDEQLRIAKALTDIDLLISSLTKLIEKKQNIKTATMQQLLTGKKRLEGFTEPGVEKKIGEIVCVSKGQSLQSKNFLNGNVPVVAGGQMYAGFHNIANHSNASVTISASGAYAGYVWLHEYPIFASDCSVIEGNDDVDIHFIYYVLKLKQKEIYQAQTGGAQPHIHPKDIEPIRIVLPFKDCKPYLNEQKAVANILNDMDKEITMLEQKRAKYEAIKKGMMQELLTGRIRLV